MAEDIKDAGMASEGESRIQWADSMMPVLRLIRSRFTEEQPLKGVKIAACLHVTSETANLMRTLKERGGDEGGSKAGKWAQHDW